MKRLFALVLSAVLLTFPVYAATAQEEITPGDIAAADAQRRAVSAELADITSEYDLAIQQTTRTTEQLRLLSVELSVAERTLVDLRVEAEEVARTMYMEAGAGGGITLLDAASINDIPVRTGYLERLSASGEATLSRLLALEAAFDEQQVRLDELLLEQESDAAALEGLAGEILQRLETADAEYRSLVTRYEAQEEAKRRAAEEARLRAEEEARRVAEEEAARQATTTAPPAGDDGAVTTTTEVTTTTTAPAPAPAPAPTGGRVCPVDGAVSFTDSWGAPRSGGRTHQGVDMIAARGTPLVAIESGVISRMSNSSLGGITLWIAGSGGDSFYYAHLDGYASGISSGQSVSVGQLIGYVGNTGNARYTIPHLHFEYHPGGGSAVNPYPLTASLCF